MTHRLLESGGSTTPVTTFLLVHRALRRDLARFPRAVRLLPADDTAQARRIVDHWRRVRGALDGHHAAEDQRLFPALLAAEPALADVIDVLDGQHAARWWSPGRAGRHDLASRRRRGAGRPAGSPWW